MFLIVKFRVNLFYLSTFGNCLQKNWTCLSIALLRKKCHNCTTTKEEILSQTNRKRSNLFPDPPEKLRNHFVFILWFSSIRVLTEVSNFCKWIFTVGFDKHVASVLSSGEIFIFRCAALFRAAKWNLDIEFDSDSRTRIGLDPIPTGHACTGWNSIKVRLENFVVGIRQKHTVPAAFDLPVAFTKSDFRRRRNFLHAPLAQRTPSCNTLKCLEKPFCSEASNSLFASRKTVIYYVFV